MFLGAPASAQVICNPSSEGYLLEWNAAGWSSPGSLSHTVDVIRDGTSQSDFDAEPVSVTVSFSGATNRFTLGGPDVTSDITGGAGLSERSVFIPADFTAMDEVITMTVEFSRPVDLLKFEIFDIDMVSTPGFFGGSGGFRDNIVVTGENTDEGISGLLPDITTPYNNSAQGQTPPSVVYVGAPLVSNRAIANPNGQGVENAGNDEDIGNAIIDFSSRVDKVTVAYSTPSDFFNTNDPQTQAIALHDLDFCVPRTPELEASKTVFIFRQDGVGCDIFPGTPPSDPAAQAAIPGACVEYELEVENIGSGASDETDITDTLDGRFIFAAARISGITPGTGYSFNTPTTMTDCGLSTCKIEVENGVIASGNTGTILVRAVLK